MSEDSREYNLEHKKVSKLVWDYALPAIIGTMVNALYNIVDRIFIGQGVGAMAISGLALTFPVMSMTGALGMLVGAGASSRISISLGQKDKERGERIMGNSLLMIIILNAVFMTLFLIFLKPILHAFGASEDTYPYARDYLQIVLMGNVFVSLCFSFNNIMRASGYPKKAMYTMLIGAVLNIILDPIFIFVFHLGIKGVAIATVISMFVGMVFVMHHFSLKTSVIRLRRKNIRLDKDIILSILSIGVSPFTMQIAAAGVVIFMNILLMRHGGDLAIGAYGIWNSIALMFVMMMIGLNQGAQPIIGYNFGAKNFSRTKETLFYCIKMALFFSVPGFLIIQLFPRQIAGIFTSDKELLDITEHAMRISSLAFPVVGVQIVISNFFQSIGYALKSIIQSLSRQILFLIPALFIFPKIWGLTGVWASMPVSDFLAFLLSLYLLLLQMRTINKIEKEHKLSIGI